MASPHILILPFPLPAEGHVVPLMELSHNLVDRGFKITFVNTEFNHNRVVHALSKMGLGDTHPTIRLASVPDGMAPEDDRNDLAGLCESMPLAVPSSLERLIRNINQSEVDKITWMLADQSMAFAYGVAKKMGIRIAGFWPVASALLALTMSIPKLIEEEVLNDDDHLRVVAPPVEDHVPIAPHHPETGLPLKQGMVKLSPDMPPMATSQFSWNLTTEPKRRKAIYQFVMNNCRATKLAEFIITNSFPELEPATFEYMPNVSPIGPLIADEEPDKPIGHFWAEDAACMNWLDEQPANSVIYMALGSLTIINQHQFQEIALGLELSGRPFLWVVRPDLTNASHAAYPEGFRDRAANRGLIVDWSPQQKVLAHPSVACFVTHCGWNSTMEGVRNGVPFLCWPSFCDQFLNQSYICDVWKVGFRLTPDDDGIVSSGQIKLKVEELLGDEELKGRSLMWKEKANDSVRVGGSSYMNMNRFLKALKE